MGRQLYRPTRNRVIAGVCGGFAEYFNIDPAVIRILCVILTLMGVGFFGYIFAWIIMPDEKNLGTANSGNTWHDPSDSGNSSFNGNDFSNSYSGDKENWSRPAGTKYDSDKTKFFVGAGLVVFGAFLLIRQVFPAFGSKFFLPLILLAIGGAIIYKGRRQS